jgi:hypothetical protein
VSLLEPKVEASPLRSMLRIATLLAAAILARWRGIILAFILFLTVWIAIQVFLLIRSASNYLYDNAPNWVAHHAPKELPLISPSGPVTTCWRDRSVTGDCFKPAGSRPKPPPTGRRTPQPVRPPCLRFRVDRPIEV